MSCWCGQRLSFFLFNFVTRLISKVAELQSIMRRLDPLLQSLLTSKSMVLIKQLLVSSSDRRGNMGVLEVTTQLLFEPTKMQQRAFQWVASAQRDTQVTRVHVDTNIVGGDDLGRLKRKLEVHIAVLQLAKSWLFASVERILLATLLVLLHRLEARKDTTLDPDCLRVECKDGVEAESLALLGIGGVKLERRPAVLSGRRVHGEFGGRLGVEEHEAGILGEVGVLHVGAGLSVTEATSTALSG